MESPSSPDDEVTPALMQDAPVTSLNILTHKNLNPQRNQHRVIGGVKPGIIVILCVQVVLALLFGFFSDYHESALPSDGSHAHEDDHHGNQMLAYPMFQDVHVMIFVGFGFLMTFLKRYGYSSAGFNFLLAALVIQWALLCRGFFELEGGKIRIGLRDMIGADVAAAAVLISMGAVLGRTTWVQLLIMGLIEIAVFATNEYLEVEIFKITDAGGSIVVHAFGAYFGLAASFVLRPKRNAGSSSLEGPSYTSDMFAMIGTLFLWIFWPSFNAAFLEGEQQHRAVINTYISLCAATVTAFCLSTLVTHEKKFDMVHIQNSTLAGGVAVGTIANLIIHPVGAIITGVLAGALSVLGYQFLSPKITSKIRIHDTCGVHNLHGMPALLSGALSAVFTAMASESEYKGDLYAIFPAMRPINQTLVTTPNPTTDYTEEDVVILTGRSPIKQAGYQLAALLLTVIIAIISGGVTGLLLRSPLMEQVSVTGRHDDSPNWELPPEAQIENHSTAPAKTNDSQTTLPMGHI